jgi:hypothetical protein
MLDHESGPAAKALADRSTPEAQHQDHAAGEPVAGPDADTMAEHVMQAIPHHKERKDA